MIACIGADQAVTPFRAFIDPVPGLTAGEVQEHSRRLLPERVSQSSLRWWSPGTPLPGTADFLLIGVAVWSMRDMSLLDILEQRVSATKPQPAVFVFDADAITSPDQLQSVFPGIGLIHHTPIVGRWENGQLVEKASGHEAKRIVIRLFGLDENRLDEPLPAAS